MSEHKVILEGVRIYAFHGYYEEERKIGGEFVVDVEVDTTFSGAAKEDELSKTVNYEQLFQIIQEEMAITSKLLEHVAQRIVQRIKKECNGVQGIDFQLRKVNPPLGGEVAYAGVRIKKNREVRDLRTKRIP